MLWFVISQKIYWIGIGEGVNDSVKGKERGFVFENWKTGGTIKFIYNGKEKTG